ncbi:MAG: response regulator [Syntrophobacteraceae bacterium]|nr:response regulator [Desulfobacteraceae bacterium]
MADGKFLIIYVVEDDEPLRKASSQMLRSDGCHIATFESDEESFDGRSRSREGCPILEIQLPGISGDDVHERLMTKGLNLPAVFATGWENPQWKEKSARMEGAEFPHKTRTV